MPTLIMDLDGTLTIKAAGTHYAELQPNEPVVAKLREYKAKGYLIAIYTARNMKTHGRSVGRINALTLPVIVDWLNKHDIPFDEIHVGKPWPEYGGFYVDDKAIRPDEFLKLSHAEIIELVGTEP